MSQNIRVLYLYIVSLISLGMIVSGFVGSVNNITKYIAPEVGYYRYYDKTEDINQSEQLEDYSKWIESEEENVKRRAIKDLFSCLALLVIATPLYLYHFKSAKNINKQEVK